MDPKTLARSIAIGRLGFGALLLARPELLARRWVGADGGRTGTQVMAMGLGVRDLALGGGTLASLSSAARPWLVASAAADAGDLLATLRHRRDLPAVSVAMLVAIAGGAAAAGAWLSAQDAW